MYAHANDIHEIDILCWFHVHIHRSRKIPVLFQNPNHHHAFPIMSTHFVMNMFACFYGLYLNPLTGGIAKFCVSTINTFSDEFKICLNLPPEQIIFVFPPAHLSYLRFLIKSSFCVNIYLYPLHSHRPQGTSIFLM